MVTEIRYWSSKLFENCLIWFDVLLSSNKNFYNFPRGTFYRSHSCGWIYHAMIHHANSPRFIISRKLYVTIFQCSPYNFVPERNSTITFHLLLTAAIISRSNFTPLHISIGQFLFIKLDVGRNRPLPALPTEWNRRRGGLWSGFGNL